MSVYHGWFERVGREPCFILPGVVFDPHSQLEGPCLLVVLKKERRPTLARIAEVEFGMVADGQTLTLAEALPLPSFDAPPLPEPFEQKAERLG